MHKQFPTRHEPETRTREILTSRSVSAGPARQRLLPGFDHRRHKLPAEWPGDLRCHQPVPRPHRGCWCHCSAGTTDYRADRKSDTETENLINFQIKPEAKVKRPKLSRLTQHGGQNDMWLFLVSTRSRGGKITYKWIMSVFKALQYGSEDNSTIVIVPFGAWGKHQSSTAIYSMSRNFASSGRWA